MKTQKRTLFLIFLFFAIAASVYAQSSGTGYTRRFNNGSALYNLGRYNEAAIEFRRAQETATRENDWAAAIYWVILSELAHSDYGSALLDMDELERRAPTSIYNRDMTYHRARIYFNQGYYENALLLFRRYIDSVTETNKDAEDRKAAAFYWIGECLFAMGQFDDAQRFYTWIVDSYPESPKKEISSYRIDLIKQKKIEAELLALLQWSHEEALRTSEDYQRRIRTYEYTLNSYQRRIAELTHGGGKTIEPPSSEEQFIDFSFDDFMSGVAQDYHGELLNKARQLGEEIEEIIRIKEEEEQW